MLLFGLLMAPIVVDVQVNASRCQRGMSEVVAHRAQIYLAVGHVRAGAVPEPMRGRLLKQIGSRARRIVAASWSGSRPKRLPRAKRSRRRSSVSARRPSHASGNWKKYVIFSRGIWRSRARRPAVLRSAYAHRKSAPCWRSIGNVARWQRPRGNWPRQANVPTSERPSIVAPSRRCRSSRAMPAIKPGYCKAGSPRSKRRTSHFKSS